MNCAWESRGVSDAVARIRACGHSKDLAMARQLHAQLNPQDVFLANLLLQAFASCGSIADARAAFEQMPRHNVFSWTIIISALARAGDHRRGLVYFSQMSCAGVKPDAVAFLAILECATPAAGASPPQATTLQTCVHESGLLQSATQGLVLANALLGLHTSWGDVDAARHLFAGMPRTDVISWTCLIAVHGRAGRADQALELLHCMDLEGIRPNAVTFSTMADSISRSRECASLSRRIADSGFLLAAGCSLIQMHAKLGELESARQLFDAMRQLDPLNLVAWTSIVDAYAQNGHSSQALELFRTMELQGIHTDAVAILALVDASSGSLPLAQWAHLRACDDASASWSSNLWNRVITMYGRCGCPARAMAAFQAIAHGSRSVVSWTAVITAHAHGGRPMQALALLARMEMEGVRPNALTLLAAMDACSVNADLAKAELLYAAACDLFCPPDGVIGNALLNMFAKCGSCERAQAVFRAMRHRDARGWNSLAAAYARCGHIDRAFGTVREMELDGANTATHITFVTLLSALAHSGALNHCLQELVSMVGDHGIALHESHCRCIVDLLARGGNLELAAELVESMPSAPASMSLLSAFRDFSSSPPQDLHHLNVAAARVISMEPDNASPYLTLADIWMA